MHDIFKFTKQRERKRKIGRNIFCKLKFKLYVNVQTKIYRLNLLRKDFDKI